jgi:hypothetical protein
VRACAGGENNVSGWVGVDLDGTLARFVTFEQMERGQTIGDPVPLMMERVRQWLDAGKEVRIFTARACEPTEIPVIKDWLREHGLPELEVTNAKDFGMMELWDDCCVKVQRNTGIVLNGAAQ